MSALSEIGLTTANDPEVASYRRLEAKILAEERERDPDFSTCPKCVARITKHLRRRKQEDNFVAKNLDEKSWSENSSLASSRRPSRVHRTSHSENEEKSIYSGGFR